MTLDVAEALNPNKPNQTKPQYCMILKTYLFDYISYHSLKVHTFKVVLFGVRVRGRLVFCGFCNPPPPHHMEVFMLNSDPSQITSGVCVNVCGQL